ncbi:sensor histidine kinase [Nocardioides sp.]|uniref:sensor histidine kinase n=1 Tax=Nocardioides sp. TaxID=35761 RepID=UPI0039E384B0
MSAATKRRWSFRTRLTALIAVVFVAGGIALLGVQYLLVRGLFDTAIDTLAGCADGTSITFVGSDDPPTDSGCTEIRGGVDDSGHGQISVGTDGTSVLVQQTTSLSREVLSGLLVWSIATLAVFTVVAVVAASWLSRRSFARIGQITDTARRITRDGLRQRLRLPGPADEIKELGDTIDAMLDGLEASFTRQERFIANASHELRTPLTTTRTALEIPLEQGRVPGHLEAAVRRALDANRRSEQLIAALLRLARATVVPTAPDDPDDPEGPVDLPAVVEHSLASRADDIEAANLTVTTSLAPASVTGVDPTLLTLAIDNLVENAVRHNHREGTIHIATGATDDRAWVEIGNSGPMLTPQETTRLTEPFNRGRDTRTIAGTRSLGLGLTLVQSIAETHEGMLTLTPRDGGGLVVRLRLGRA